MSRKRIEQRLADVGERLRALREEASILQEHYAQVAEEADEASLQALVAATPQARHDRHDAQRSAETLARRRDAVEAKIDDLQVRQDELLDELGRVHDR